MSSPPDKELFTLSLDKKRLKANDFGGNHCEQEKSKECYFFIIDVNTFGGLVLGLLQGSSISEAADTYYEALPILEVPRPNLNGLAGHFVGYHIRRHGTSFIIYAF